MVTHSITPLGFDVTKMARTATSFFTAVTKSISRSITVSSEKLIRPPVFQITTNPFRKFPQYYLSFFLVSLTLPCENKKARPSLYLTSPLHSLTHTH